MSNIMFLKSSELDNNLHIDELNEFIFENVKCIDEPVNDDKNNFYQYKNKQSNKLFFKSTLFEIYLNDNYKIFRSKIYDYKMHHTGKQFINICVVGGGNLSELISINKVLRNNSMKASVTLIDKVFWPYNAYNSNLIQQHDLSNILELKLVCKDFFDELETNISFDFVVFSRVIYYAEYTNYLYDQYKPIDENSLRKYATDFANIVLSLLNKDSYVISIVGNENTNETENAKKFNKSFINLIRSKGSIIAALCKPLKQNENDLFKPKSSCWQFYSKTSYTKYKKSISNLNNSVLNKEIVKVNNHNNNSLKIGETFKHPNYGICIITEIETQDDGFLVIHANTPLGDNRLFSSKWIYDNCTIIS